MPRGEGRQYSEDELQSVFDEINADKSGEIDKLQLKKALKHINPHADDALAEAMLTIADADGDVRVSFDEFITIIRGDPLKQGEARRRWRSNGMAAQSANRLDRRRRDSSGDSFPRMHSPDACKDGSRPASRSFARRQPADDAGEGVFPDEQPA